MKARRNNYASLLDESTREKLVSLLNQEGRLPRGLYQQIHRATGVPIPNLKRWRKELLNGRDPFDHSWRQRPRALPKEAEDEIFSIVLRRMSSGVHCPRTYLQRVALDVGRRYDQNFLAGRSWVQGFLKRYNLSFRKPHLRRRSRPNDPIVAEFLQFIEVARMEIPDACICNMDETAWRLTNGRLETLAKRGTDEVTSNMAIDERTCVTVICTITADGRKLPPWVVLKGKTDKTGKKYAQDPRLRRYIENKRLYLTYSENGWASTKVIKEYLAWFSEQMEGQWSVLVWDLYSSHRNAEIQKWAAEQHINFVNMLQCRYIASICDFTRDFLISC